MLSAVQEPERVRPEVPPAGRQPSFAGWGVAHLVALALVLGAGVFSLAPPSDPDVWWHVKAGRWILDNAALPSTDPWSLTAEGRDWVAHSWLSEVVIALFHDAFGLKGLALFRSLGVLMLLGTLAVQAFRRTTPGRALLVTSLALLATRGGWGERPQLISFIILAAAAQLVRAAIAGRVSPWWLVPLTWLWANVHGLWFLGPALLVVAMLGTLGDRGWRGGRDRAARLTTVALACTGAAALTPNGPEILLQPLRVNAYGRFVSEWGPVDVHAVWGFGFFTMVLLFLMAYGRHHGKQDWFVLAQVTFAIVLGLMYTRTVAPAAVMLTPLLAEALGRTSAPMLGSFSVRFTRSAASLLVLLGLAGGAAVWTQQPELPPAAPVEATRVLSAVTPDGAGVLNEYGIGGWLLLFAPDVRPAIDGRAEIYPQEFVGEYISAVKMNGDWKSTILPLQAHSAFLHAGTPLVNGLRDELGWRTAYENEDWVVLVRPDAERS